MKPPAHVMRRAVIACAALVVLVLAAGCGDDETGVDTSVVPPDTPVATTVTEPPGRIPPLIDNDDPEKVVCTRPSDGTFDATSIVGQTLEAATATVEEAGCSIRVIEEDGVSLAVTDDYSPTRVNVVVEDGRVTRVDGLY